MLLPVRRTRIFSRNQAETQHRLCRISFLPQTFLLENIEQNTDRISPFLQLSLLTVAAQWTPSLVRRYGGAKEAGDHFYSLAKTMIGAEMLRVSLEACQACEWSCCIPIRRRLNSTTTVFLLSVFCWGRGNSEETTVSDSSLCGHGLR